MDYITVPLPNCQAENREAKTAPVARRSSSEGGAKPPGRNHVEYDSGRELPRSWRTTWAGRLYRLAGALVAFFRCLSKKAYTLS